MKILITCILLITPMFLSAQEKFEIKSGEKIAFMGDSITAAGNRRGGYVQLVMQALKMNGLKVTHAPAGISGHKSNQMLARLKKELHYFSFCQNLYTCF